MRHGRDGLNRGAVVSILSLLLAACAGIPRDASLPINDPNEQVNRQMMAVTVTVARPAAQVVHALPGPIQDRLRDFNSNLKEPRILVNNVLQGRFDAAHTTFARLLQNSVFGFGGLFDIAAREGLQQASGDFGQTLFVWGVPEGQFVMRPYLGPSTLRDAVGSVVDMVADPVGWATGSRVYLAAGVSVLEATERLGQLKQAEDASIDFYTFVRSTYYQMRRAELREAIGLPNDIASPALDDPEAASADKPQSPAVADPTAPRRSSETSGGGKG
jgi:phospholipid-binding lipoprotein MlaA